MDDRVIQSRAKTSEWNEYVISWLSHSTYVNLIPLTCLKENENEIESVPSEEENEEMNEKHEDDHEVDFEEIEDEIQKIPKLNLNRLMSARSTCSVKRTQFKLAPSHLIGRSHNDFWLVDYWTGWKPNIFKIYQE